METVSTGVIEWAVAELVLPGQTESGDRCLVTATSEGGLVAVVDGLGHGAEAAGAAKAAVSSLERHAQDPIIQLIRSCHRSLAGTRGVVMSVAAFDPRAETMTWVGVGNVEGVLLRAQAAASPRREMLLLRGGVVGVHLPALAAAILPVARGDVLILATEVSGTTSPSIPSPTAIRRSSSPIASSRGGVPRPTTRSCSSPAIWARRREPGAPGARGRVRPGARELPGRAWRGRAAGRVRARAEDAREGPRHARRGDDPAARAAEVSHASSDHQGGDPDPPDGPQALRREPAAVRDVPPPGPGGQHRAA